MMALEQLRQILRVQRIILGAAGHECLAELLQGDRINGIEGDEVDPGQEGDQVGCRLLQAETDPASVVALLEMLDPKSEHLGRGGNGVNDLLPGAQIQEAKVGFAIGTIQANDDLEGW